MLYGEHPVSIRRLFSLVKRFRATDAERRTPPADVDVPEPLRPSAGEQLAKVIGIGRRKGDIAYVKG